MSYLCPRCPDREFAGLTGWKRHMTHTHKGYSVEELATASGSISDQPVRERMIEFSRSVPESGTGSPSDARMPGEGEPPPAPAPAPKPAPEPEKRVKVSPKKLRKLIATLPVEWFERQGITLDEEDKDAVEEAVEFLQEVFGVEFAVPSEKYIVRSRLWAMLWPIGVFIFIFFKHKTKAMLSEVITSPEEKLAEPDHGSSGTDRQREEP